MLLFTNIYHRSRRNLGLTVNEYCIADSVYHLATNPESTKKGWCYMSRGSMAEEFGFSRQSIITIINKLIKKGILTKDPRTDYLKTTSLWNRTYLETKGNGGKVDLKEPKGVKKGVKKVYTKSDKAGCKESLQGCKESLQAGCKESLQEGVKKVYTISIEDKESKDKDNDNDKVLNKSEKTAFVPAENDFDNDLILDFKSGLKVELNGKKKSAVETNVKRGDLGTLFVDGYKIPTNDIKVPKNEQKTAKKAIEPTLIELANIANEKLAKGTYPTKELAATFEIAWNGLFKDDDLKFPFDGKEMSQLKLFAKKIHKAVCDRQGTKTITVEFLISSFKLFLDKTIETADQFTLDKFTPSYLNSQYGSILTKIRKGNGNGTTAKNGKVKTTFNAANIAAAMERVEAKAKAMGM
jgi:hypothetical protein